MIKYSRFGEKILQYRYLFFVMIVVCGLSLASCGKGSDNTQEPVNNSGSLIDPSEENLSDASEDSPELGSVLFPEEEEPGQIEDVEVKQGSQSQGTLEVSETDMSSQPIFEVSMIDESLASEMKGNSYHENPIIQLEDLRLVKVGYVDFNDEARQGELVVHHMIATKILDVFKVLYEGRYPIESIIRIDSFEGDDHTSMVANNTSAFNYRLVSGTTHLSNHAYGLAIDINPLLNPYIKKGVVDPPEGELYVDRSLGLKGMIIKGDLCYETFTQAGFTWGGDWANSKDYQHFDIRIDGINE